jgi:hypothetical protein
MKYTKEILLKLSKEFTTTSDILRSLGKPTKGGYIYELNRKFKEFSIDITHFQTHSEFMKGLQLEKGGSLLKKTPLKELLVKGYRGKARTGLIKRRVLNSGLLENICDICGQDENWVSGKISLILDHVNGDNNDNRIQNLRIVCPNCDTTLPTYKGRNKK